MHKEFRIPVLIFIFCFLITINCIAASNNQGDIAVEDKIISTPYNIIEGRLYMPLRAVCEAYGFDIQWSGKDKKILLNKKGSKIEIDLDKNKIASNNHDIFMLGEYEAVGGKTYMREDFFSECLGIDINLNQAIRKVWLKSAKENSMLITTQKEICETGNLTTSIQYPKIEGLNDKDIQEKLNIKFKELAMKAKNEGLKNEKQMSKDTETRHIKLETYFNYKVKYNSNNILSLVFTDYQYNGGAHGLTVQSSFLFNLKTGLEYKIKDLFRDKADYTKFISDEIKKRMQEKGISTLLTPFNTIKAAQDFYLTNNSLVIYFQDYEYLPHAYGIPEFIINYATIEDVMNSDFDFLGAIPLDYKDYKNEQHIKIESKIEIRETIKSIDIDKGRAFIYRRSDDTESLHAGYADVNAIYDLGELGTRNTPLELTYVKRINFNGKTVLKYQGVFGSNASNTQYFTIGADKPKALLSTEGFTSELDINKDGLDEIIAEMPGTLPTAKIFKFNGSTCAAASVELALGVQSVIYERENGSFVINGPAINDENKGLRYVCRGDVLRAVNPYIANEGILSDNDIFTDPDSELKKIRVKMIEGKTFEDTAAGPYKGWNWQGEFTIQLVDEEEKVISEIGLNNIFQDKDLIFNKHFRIRFDDINNDGFMDFAIGQYGTSNGNFYKLFTIKKDKLEVLQIKSGDIFSSECRSRYTTEFERYGLTNFINRYYDNSKGEIIEQLYTWDGSQFVAKPIGK